MKSSLGVKRLSLVLGIVGGSIGAVISIAGSDSVTPAVVVVVAFILCAGLGFLILWGLTRLTYWIVQGFKKDHET
jgi:hypothetical protein